MKTLSLVVLLVASLAFMLSGCSENSTPVVGPFSSTPDQGGTPGSPGKLAKEGVLHSVTGSCQSYLVLVDDPFLGPIILPGPKGKDSYYNTISINALERPGEDYSGIFVSQFHRVPKDQATDALAKVTGRVVHVAVQGSIAKIIFEIVDGDLTGQWGVIAFGDNGEGGGPGSPDKQGAWMFSPSPDDMLYWKSLTPQEYIDWTVDLYQPYLPWFTGWLPLDNGNIQIR